jgi:SAM-dependent methyltransferase
VLDVGCADGEVAVAIAPFVERLHGLDIRPDAVQQANDRAAAQGIANASFEVAAIGDYSFEPRTWDVTLFMRVWGKGKGVRAVGASDLSRVLGATGRQAILQAGKPRSEKHLTPLLELCDDEGFDAAWFVGVNLIVANRRDAGARLHAVPERVLVRAPSGSRLVPAAEVCDHPILGSVVADRRAAI